MTVSDEGSRRETTDFGFERVALSEKQGRVDSVFHSVARRYDLMNDLMSAGLHRAWKAQLVSMLRPSKTRPYAHLDVAGGTGDVAFRVLEAGGRRRTSPCSTLTNRCCGSAPSGPRAATAIASRS